MQNLRSTLPPPNQLVMFEAAGRLLSFTRAATELNVTRVAVSQQIRSLEDFLGVKLFNRQHRSIELTIIGKRYHAAISNALESATLATKEIIAVTDKRIVNVMATAGFTTYWLMPNIGDFRSRHPDIDLRFTISDSFLDLRSENIDVAIRYGQPPFAGYNEDFLAKELITPTCAAHLIGDNCTLTIDDFMKYPLIHLDGPYDEQTRWQHWFRTNGIENRNSLRGITVNTYTNLVQAALDGQGFALIGTPLIQRFLKSGLLVQPLSQPPIERRSFYLLHSNDQIPSKTVELFRIWIKEKFQKSVS